MILETLKSTEKTKDAQKLVLYYITSWTVQLCTANSDTGESFIDMFITFAKPMLLMSQPLHTTIDYSKATLVCGTGDICVHECRPVTDTTLSATLIPEAEIPSNL